MTAELFHITCTTCQARLKVHNPAAIGLILECPRCHSMVRVVPPAGWDPPPAVPSSPVASSADLPPEVPTDLPPDVPGDVPADVPARDDGVDTAPADVPADSAEVSVAAGRWPRPILWAAAAGLSLLVVGGIAIVVMLVSPAAPAGRSVVARADLRPVVPARDRVAAAPESTSVRSSAGPAEKPAPGPAPAAGRKPAANAMPAASSSPQHRTRTVPEGAATGRASSSTAGKKTKKRVPRAPSPPSVRRKAPAPPGTTPSTAPPER